MLRCGGLLLFPLDLPAARLRSLEALLDQTERERAGRFLAAVHRDRFIAAHGILREQLGALLDMEPAVLEFIAAEHGKPQLAGAAAGSGIDFNLSHSGDLALLGWSQGRHIGVDLEVWRHMTDATALVRRFFSLSENAAYAALAESDRERGFFECWTRKEAYIKAIGRGLGLPLDSFDVSFGRGRPAALLRQAVADGRTWSLSGLDLDHGMSGAVVLEADSCHVLAAAA